MDGLVFPLVWRLQFMMAHCTAFSMRTLLSLIAGRAATASIAYHLARHMSMHFASELAKRQLAAGL